MQLRNLDDFVLELGQKKANVFLRCDLNITPNDFTRVDLSIPTIKRLMSIPGVKKLFICTHLGRPKSGYQANLSVKNQLLNLLENSLNIDIDVVDVRESDDIIKLLNESKEGTRVFLLENIRFLEGEEANGEELVDLIASFSDVFVNDAFGVSHRKHASVFGISEVLTSYSGLLLEKEFGVLNDLFNNSNNNSVLVIGGAKIEDKAGVMINLIDRVDKILVGGGMVESFLSGQLSKIIKDKLLKDNLHKIIFPRDVVVASEFDQSAAVSICNSDKFDGNGFIIDVGPRTSKNFDEIIQSADLIVWNGSLGVFEWESGQNGTVQLLKSIEENNTAKSYAGGGSTIEAINRLGKKEVFTHISSGGGAFLELLESGTLSGIKNLYKEE